MMDAEGAIALASDLPDDLPTLRAAMMTLGEGIVFLTDADKDRRTEAYVTIRNAAVHKFQQAPAKQTDPWGWEAFLAEFKRRNGGVSFNGTGEGITSAMMTKYMETQHT